MLNINAGFPVCSVAIIINAEDNAAYIVAGGGGGPSKSGIPNGIAVYSTTGQRVAMLDTSGDPVMCVAVQREPLFDTKSVLVAGVGIRGWRVTFSPKDDSLLLTSSSRTDHGGDEDPHQRMVVVGEHLIATVACDAAIRLWTITDSDGWEQEECLLFNGSGDCVNDITMLSNDNQDTFYCIVNHTDIFRFHKNQHDKWIKTGVTFQKRPGFMIRCMRRSGGFDCLFFICSINRQKKCSFIDCYNTSQGELVFTTRLHHVITAVCIDDDLMSIGCSDGTVCIYLVQHARKRLKLVHKYEHSFAVTSICVKREIVVSGSADGSVKMVKVLYMDGGGQVDTILLLLASTLLILISHLLYSYKSQFTLL